MLEFLDSYEKQEIELKMKAFEAGEKQQQLEKELKEVWHCFTAWGGVAPHHVCVCVCVYCRLRQI